MHIKMKDFLIIHLLREICLLHFMPVPPFISEAGFALGTICVFDQQAKNLFIPAQKQALKTLAGLVSKLLELKAKNKLIIEKSNCLIEAEKKLPG